MRIIPFSALMLALGLATPAPAQDKPGVERTAAGGVPEYEASGLPITRVQMQVVGLTHVRERSPAPALTVAGMPASPHQVAVLTPRSKGNERELAGASPPAATAALSTR